MNYDSRILLEAEMEFKNVTFFRASYCEDLAHSVFQNCKRPVGTVHSSGELRFW